MDAGFTQLFTFLTPIYSCRHRPFFFFFLLKVLLGEDLVGPVLVRSVPDFAEQFFVVAYNIRARGEEGLRAENSGKNVHVRRVAEHYGVELGSVLLLDDDSRNIRDTKGCHVVRVSGG